MNDWEDSAACRGLGHRLFFFEKGASDTAVTVAKAICADCPVRGDCLEWALANRTMSRFGIWGGTTEQERRRILRQRRIAPTQEQAA